MVQILIGVVLDLPKSKPPKEESSELLIIKFLGYGFFASLGISGVLAVMNSEQLSIFTHLTIGLAGALIGIIKSRYNPPK